MRPHRNIVTSQIVDRFCPKRTPQLDLDGRAVQDGAAWFVPSPDDTKRTCKALSKFDAKIPLLLHARERWLRTVSDAKDLLGGRSEARRHACARLMSRVDGSDQHARPPIAMHAVALIGLPHHMASRWQCTASRRPGVASPCSQDRLHPHIYIASRSTTTALLQSCAIASHARSARAGRDAWALIRSSALPRAAFAPCVLAV